MIKTVIIITTEEDGTGKMGNVEVIGQNLSDFGRQLVLDEILAKQGIRVELHR